MPANRNLSISPLASCIVIGVAIIDTIGGVRIQEELHRLGTSDLVLPVDDGHCALVMEVSGEALDGDVRTHIEEGED